MRWECLLSCASYCNHLAREADRSTCIPELRKIRALVSRVDGYLRLSRHSLGIFCRKQNAVVALSLSSGIGGMPIGRFSGVNDLASAGKWRRRDVLSVKKTSVVRPVHCV